MDYGAHNYFHKESSLISPDTYSNFHRGSRKLEVKYVAFSTTKENFSTDNFNVLIELYKGCESA